MPLLWDVGGAFDWRANFLEDDTTSFCLSNIPTKKRKSGRKEKREATKNVKHTYTHTHIHMHTEEEREYEGALVCACACACVCLSLHVCEEETGSMKEKQRIAGIFVHMKRHNSQ